MSADRYSTPNRNTKKKISFGKGEADPYVNQGSTPVKGRNSKGAKLLMSSKNNGRTRSPILGSQDGSLGTGRK